MNRWKGIVVGLVLGVVISSGAAGAYTFETQTNTELTHRLNALCKSITPDDGTPLLTWQQACPNVAGPQGVSFHK